MQRCHVPHEIVVQILRDFRAGVRQVDIVEKYDEYQVGANQVSRICTNAIKELWPIFEQEMPKPRRKNRSVNAYSEAIIDNAVAAGMVLTAPRHGGLLGLRTAEGRREYEFPSTPTWEQASAIQNALQRRFEIPPVELTAPAPEPVAEPEPEPETTTETTTEETPVEQPENENVRSEPDPEPARPALALATEADEEYASMLAYLAEGPQHYSVLQRLFRQLREAEAGRVDAQRAQFHMAQKLQQLQAENTGLHQRLETLSALEAALTQLRSSTANDQHGAQ